MGGGGPKKVKSTTTTAPSDLIAPQIGQAAQAASNAFNRSGGNDLQNQSVDLFSRTLAGDFLSPDSNPYLQDTFDRAAQLTRGRLNTEFAGAGRDQIAALPARSQELQDLAGSIFGGNFARERMFQNEAATSSQSLDPTNQFIDRIARLVPGAGGTTTSTQPVFKTGLF
jgi:hypothetical protein